MRSRTTTLSFVLVLFAFSAAAANLEPAAKNPAKAVREDFRVPGMLQVKYTVDALPQIRVQKMSSGVAEVGIASLDQIHREMGVRAVNPPAYEPKNKQLAAELGLNRYYVLEFPTTTNVEFLSKRLAADPNVEAVIPVVNFEQHAVPTDPNYAAHWGHNNTAQLPGYDWGGSWDHTLAGVGTVGFDSNAQVGWNSPQGYGNAGVTIAIIDSGVDVDHPDYNYVGGWDFISGDANPDESINAHGTACAGIAAATANNGLGAAGAAPNCGIMALRSSNNVHTTSSLIYAADNGADVISMSFSFTGYGPGIITDVEAACAYAAAADVVLLSSAGNDNIGTVWVPANHASVITVGAASPCGGRKRSSSLPGELNPGVSADPNGWTCDGERWWGSSWGANIQNGSAATDFIAPTILPTTDILGAGGYQPGNYEPFFNGTSCSCPYAAGVAALVRSLHPTWTAVQVRNHLRNTAIDINDVDAGPGWDQKTGYGMIDMAAALALPDLRVYTPGTWSDSIVPSNVTATTTFPAILNGDGATYIDAAIVNFGTAASTVAFNEGVYRDGVLTINAAGIVPHNVNIWSYFADVNRTFTGGRHVLKQVIDTGNTVQELNESNNLYARQFAWTPADLAPNTMVTRSAPPGGTADWPALVASGNATNELNNDSMGFKPNVGVGYWRAISTHSTSNAAAQDYDIGLMNPTSDIFTGNDNASWTGIQSLNVGGILDALIVNDNLDGSDYEATIWNQSGSGTVNNLVEHRVSALPEFNADNGGTEVIGFAVNQMIAMREFHSGNQAIVGVNIEVIGASQPVRVAVFDHNFQRGTLANAAATQSTNAAGKATINHATLANNFYGVAIYRNPVDGNAAISVRLTIRGPVDLTVVNTAPAPVSSFNMPNGAGDPATAAQLLGGGAANATITAVVTNSVTGSAQVGVPAADIRWTVGGVSDCDPLGLPADSPTDATGFTRFTLPRRSGGFGTANFITALNTPSASWFPSGPGFWHNSADITGDLLVNLLDVSAFAADYTGAYAYRSDFRWDGILDLLDVTRLAAGLAVDCASPKMADGAELATGGSLGIFFDAEGTLASASVEPNRDLTAYVVATGEAARSGISAWEAALDVSENVVIHDVFLGERVVNVGDGYDFVVGLGNESRRSDSGVVVLATLQMRVLDENAAQLSLRGSRDAELPAVVVDAAEQSSMLALELDANNGATATLNDGRGPRIGDETPFNFEGYQLSNAPNPFNPSTEIRFALPQAGQAEVRIFDVAGRAVRELSGGKLSAGTHTLQWNGTDRRGAGVVSGVYYYKLFVDGQEVGTTERMLLLK